MGVPNHQELIIGDAGQLFTKERHGSIHLAFVQAMQDQRSCKPGPAQQTQVIRVIGAVSDNGSGGRGVACQSAG